MRVSHATFDPSAGHLLTTKNIRSINPTIDDVGKVRRRRTTASSPRQASARNAEGGPQHEAQPRVTPHPIKPKPARLSITNEPSDQRPGGRPNAALNNFHSPASGGLSG